MKSKFSSNLARIRKNRGISQKELAKITGLTRRMIAYYENECSNNLIEKLNSIAKALNVNISDLLGLNNSNKKKLDYLQIDSRTMDKIKKLLSLSKEDRHTIYNMVDALIAKKEVEKSNSF